MRKHPTTEICGVLLSTFAGFYALASVPALAEGRPAVSVRIESASDALLAAADTGTAERRIVVAGDDGGAAEPAPDDDPEGSNGDDPGSSGDGDDNSGDNGEQSADGQGEPPSK